MQLQQRFARVLKAINGTGARGRLKLIASTSDFTSCGRFIRMKVVVELNSHDVLFGRGSGPNDHEGNVRFRRLVAERKEEYMATNHRMTKAKIARAIVDRVVVNNGRFLKKLEPKEMKEHGITSCEAWMEVDEETVMEKAKQALRQNPNKAPKEKEPAQFGTSKPAGSHATGIAQLPEILDEFNLDPIPIGSTSTGYVKNSSPVLPNQAVTSAQGGYIGHQHWDQAQPLAMQQQAQPLGIQQQTEAQMQAMQSAGFAPNLQIQPTNPPTAFVSQEMDTLAAGAANTKSEEPGALPEFQQNLRASITSIGMTEAESRRGSISIHDLMKMQRLREKGSDRGSDRQSMDMDELLDSFSKSKISQEELNKKLSASSETMGTIEPIGAGSAADMSFATMNSSTFSFLKGNDSVLEDRAWADSDARHLQGATSIPEEGGVKQGSTRNPSEASLSLAELRNRRKVLSGSGGTSMTLSSHTGSTAGSLRPMTDIPSLDLEGMGNSSVEMLRGMLFSANELQEQEGEDAG